jgi:hypothetical protein
VPTRQTSSSGRPKSPRIQVVLPEELCQRLAVLAEDESRTVSNMAKVLIQQGVERLERERPAAAAAAVPAAAVPPAPGSPTALAPTASAISTAPASGTDRFRAELERRESDQPRRLRGAPRRLRLRPPGG